MVGFPAIVARLLSAEEFGRNHLQTHLGNYSVENSSKARKLTLRGESHERGVDCFL
jgi:hypothetical protein